MAAMSDPDQVSAVWRDLDRLAFCENAILLELKDKSQGPMIKASAVEGQRREPRRDDEEYLEAFLDDIALIAAADGGKANVTAACLEKKVDEPRALIIRIARNEGVDEGHRAALQELIDIAKFEQVPPTTQLPNQHISDCLLLKKVVQMCHGRVKKHVDALLGEFKNGKCLDASQCEPPAYQAGAQITAHPSDMVLFGSYDGGSHTGYAQAVNQRVNDLRRLCSRVDSTRTDKTSSLCEIVWTASTLHRSSLLRRWLETNLRFTTRSTAAQTTLLDDIVMRVGKLSRFFRATVRVAQSIKILGSTATSITVAGLHNQRLRVDELQHRSQADLRARGGVLCTGIPDDRLRRKCRLWNKYRVHAEIQLIIFYEQHVDIARLSDYVGGDKLCCFLCYHFITMHAQFKANGCHQSLYSLWMVPDHIPGLPSEAANRIHHVLARLCAQLQHRVNEISQLTLFKSPYHPGRESCNNSSRASYPTNLHHQPALVQRERTPRQEQSSQHTGQYSNKDVVQIGSSSRQVGRAASSAISNLSARYNHPKGQYSQISQSTISPDLDLQTASAESSGGLASRDVVAMDSDIERSVMIKESHSPVDGLPRPTTPTPSSITRGNTMFAAHLRRPTMGRRARLCNDPNSQQPQELADAMGDHESRACHVPIAHNVRTWWATGTSRKSDFHELELFFEFEPPATTTVVVLPDQQPSASGSQVVDVTKLVPGAELTIDFGTGSVGDGTLFLNTGDGVEDEEGGQTRVPRWVQLMWQNEDEEI